MADETGRPADDAYTGLLGAFPYAARASDSLLFRSYAVVGGLLAGFVAAVMLLGVVKVVGDTAGVGGGSLTVSRPFYVVVGVFVVLPVLAPVILVARAHRRAERVSARYDALMAAAGYAFVAAVYVSLVVSAPPEWRDPPAGALAPVVAALYALPPVAGLALLAAAAVSILAVHRFAR